MMAGYPPIEPSVREFVKWIAEHLQGIQGYVTRGGVEARRSGALLPALPASILASADTGRIKASKGRAVV